MCKCAEGPPDPFTKNNHKISVTFSETFQTTWYQPKGKKTDSASPPASCFCFIHNFYDVFSGKYSAEHLCVHTCKRRS